MYKHLKIIVILFLLGSSICAQESVIWPKPGATWKYLSFQCTEFAYTRDTVIENHSYKVVDIVSVNNNPLMPDDTFLAWEASEFSTFFRTSGDTIFRWVEGSDYIFMIHNLDVGNDFESFRSAQYDWNSYACREILPLEVSSIEEITYNEIIYREVGLEAVDWAESYAYFPYHEESTFKFIENIGLKTNFIYFMDGFDAVVSDDLDDCVSSVVEVLFMGPLHQYQDDEVSISFFPGSCLPSSTVTYKDAKELQIYQNPGNGFVNYRFKIDGVAKVNIKVFDLSGKSIYTLLNSDAEGQFDLGSIAPGLYIIKAASNDAVYTKKLVVQ